MKAYLEYNDRSGADIRYLALASREARARYLEALREYDSGDITLYMSKQDLQRRLQEARYARDRR